MECGKHKEIKVEVKEEVVEPAEEQEIEEEYMVGLVKWEPESEEIELKHEDSEQLNHKYSNGDTNKLKIVKVKRVPKPGQKSSCIFCNAFLSPNNLFIHLRRHIHEKPVSCQDCDYYAIIPVDVRKHWECMHAIVPGVTFKCSTCQAPFLTKFELQVHCRDNHERLAHTCEFCGLEFSNQQVFHKHQGSHKEAYFPCQICEKIFARRDYLSKHLKLHSAGKIKEPHKCLECGEQFAAKTTLEHHQRLHSGEKWNCDICGARFHFRKDLSAHLQAHKRKREFKCKICQKEFETVIRWRDHCRSHTNEKPFQCEICGKSYGSRGRFREHFDVEHIGEEKYECRKGCGRKFLSLRIRKKHENKREICKPFGVEEDPKMSKKMLMAAVQILEKNNEEIMKANPFLCSKKKCRARFGSKDQLVDHEENDHKGKWVGIGIGKVQCEDCGRMFKNKACVVNHQRQSRNCRRKSECKMEVVDNKLSKQKGVRTQQGLSGNTKPEINKE